MFDFFAYSTTNSWDENVFQLTFPGIFTVAVLIALLVVAAALLTSKKQETRKITAKQITFSGAAMALGIVTSMIHIVKLPMGGSVTLLSMLFIVLIGYWYGPKAGLITAVAYGLLQFILEPVFYSIPQMLVDYPLAFGALGLSGFFSNQKHGLIKGYIAGVLGRYVFAFLSGLLFFASYAEGSGMSAPVYSLAYNGSYLLTEAAITIIIVLIPPVGKALLYIKSLAVKMN